MLFSRKTILTKGKKPLYAASRVVSASCGSASSVFARCWVHSTNKTSALLRTVKSQGFRRAYSAKSGADGPTSSAGAGSQVALPLYRTSSISSGVVCQLHSRPHPGRLINAWTETPTKWYPLPLAVGALLLVAIQYRKKVRRAQKEVQLDENGMEIIKLKGPWHVRPSSAPPSLLETYLVQVHVLGALPLRNMSRLWGYVNSLELPVWFRPHGLRLYAYAFGCNLDEIEPSDLREYPSLGAFFYRKLKDGVRPVAQAALVRITLCFKLPTASDFRLYRSVLQMGRCSTSALYKTCVWNKSRESRIPSTPSSAWKDRGVPPPSPPPL